MKCWRRDMGRSMLVLLGVAPLRHPRLVHGGLAAAFVGRPAGVGDPGTRRRRPRAFATTTLPRAPAASPSLDHAGFASRRRRGAMHAARRGRGPGPLAATDTESDAAGVTTVTRYTIDDTVCPPTDPDTLETIVRKHVKTLPRYWKARPVANHTAAAFEEALGFAIRFGAARGEARTKVVLDSGCGTGRSSFLLGEKYPDCAVIGIDQSLARLSRNKSYNNHQDTAQLDPLGETNGNVLLLRAELSDFWKCCLSSSLWQRHVEVHRHYLLYPNPYPKKSRLKNRFYAHPAFPLLMMASMIGSDPAECPEEDAEMQEKLIVRSNWKGYLEEFCAAVQVWGETGGTVEDFLGMVGDDGVVACGGWEPMAPPIRWETSGPELLDTGGTALTNFEAKYFECGESVYEVSIFRVG